MTNESTFQLAVSERLFKEISSLKIVDEEVKKMENMITVLKNLRKMKTELESVIWKSQNLVFYLLKSFKNGERTYPSEKWEQTFLELCEMFKVRS